MRRAAKVDSIQPAIVSALRKAGASVEPLHMVGRGVPDLLVGLAGRTMLVEVKTGNGGLTDDQVVWHRMWRGSPVAIVRSVEDALYAIGFG